MPKITLQNLGPLLKEERGKRGIREVAKEIGISSATLSRVERGKLPDLDTFTKICNWLSIDPGEVLGCKPQQKKANSSAIYAHYRADKNLSPNAANALAKMILAAQKMFME